MIKLGAQSRPVHTLFTDAVRTIIDIYDACQIQHAYDYVPIKHDVECTE